MTAQASSSTVIVLTTIAADADATALAKILVDERLAACVNILPGVRSIYRWKDDVAEDHEQQLVIKTAANRVAALESRLRAIHPYEVPEFLVLDVSSGSNAYLAWVLDSVR